MMLKFGVILVGCVVLAAALPQQFQRVSSTISNTGGLYHVPNGDGEIYEISGLNGGTFEIAELDLGSGQIKTLRSSGVNPQSKPFHKTTTTIVTNGHAVTSLNIPDASKLSSHDDLYTELTKPHRPEQFQESWSEYSYGHGSRWPDDRRPSPPRYDDRGRNEEWDRDYNRGRDRGWWNRKPWDWGPPGHHGPPPPPPDHGRGSWEERRYPPPDGHRGHGSRWPEDMRPPPPRDDDRERGHPRDDDRERGHPRDDDRRKGPPRDDDRERSPDRDDNRKRPPPPRDDDRESSREDDRKPPPRRNDERRRNPPRDDERERTPSRDDDRETDSGSNEDRRKSSDSNEKKDTLLKEEIEDIFGDPKEPKGNSLSSGDATPLTSAVTGGKVHKEKGTPVFQFTPIRPEEEE